MSYRLALAILIALGQRARADDIDVSAIEYLDVLETTDGSVWKGVVIEQVPNVSFKIATSDGSVHVLKTSDVTRLTKQRNPAYHHAASTEGSSLPEPFARTGLRGDSELDVVFPTGTLGDTLKVKTSFAPTLRIGYEALLGNVGVSGGFQVRFSYWRLPGMTDDSGWLLETHAYGRGALHIGRAAPYLGISIGTDVSYLYSAALDDSATALGFGMNLEFGLAIAATPMIAVDLGGDYQAPTCCRMRRTRASSTSRCGSARRCGSRACS